MPEKTVRPVDKFELERDQVFGALDIERNYQLRRWGIRQEGNKFTETQHSVDEFILYMEHYLAKARTLITENAEGSEGEQKGLGELRKVVALGVACFEQNGMPIRQNFDLEQVINARDGRLA